MTTTTTTTSRPVLARITRFEESCVTLELGRDLVERSGLRAGDALEAFAPGGGVLVVGRESRRGHFAGSLDAVSMPEVFGLLGTGLRTGVLVVHSPAVRRRLVVREGQVVYASSTDPAERLGAVLWRNGMVELDALVAHETRVAPGMRLGRVLTEAGLLTPAQLYRGVQLQVQEIALGAFIETEGDFAFLEGADAGEIETVKLIVRTRDLVLEGISRAERAARWRERYDFAAHPARTSRPDAGGAGFEAAALLAAIDGARTLREAAQVSRLAVYPALRAVDQLVQAGLVDPGASPRPGRAPGASSPTGFVGLGPLQRYRLAIRLVSEELRASGKLQRLESYFDNLALEHRRVLEGVHLDASGELDVDAVQANAHRLHSKSGALARAVALEALDAFLSFALFDARNVLPTEQSSELTRETARILRER